MSLNNPIPNPIDLTREVTGVLPPGNIDPSIANKVGGVLNLGTGNVLIPTVDGSHNLNVKSLKAGTNVSFLDDGSTLTIAASSAAGGGDMLKSIYDINNDSIVDVAALANTVAAASVGTAGLAANAVTAAKIANATITNTQLAAGAAAANLGFTPVTNVRNVNTSNSLAGGGALSADLTLTLVGDTASPGNNKFYGTNGSGTRGWYATGLGDMLKATYDVANHGWVDRAASADTVAALGVGTASIAANAVTAAKIANATITGTQMAAGASVANLGFTPVNRAGDSGITGDLTITNTGPTIDNTAPINGHLTLQTSGNAGGFPVVGFNRAGTSDGTGGGLAVYFTGNHRDLNLRYADGTTGTLLSTNSAIAGSQITSINGSIISAGTIPNSALATPPGGVATLVNLTASTNQTLDCTGAILIAVSIAFTSPGIAITLNNVVMGAFIRMYFKNNSGGSHHVFVNGTDSNGTTLAAAAISSSVATDLVGTGVVAAANTNFMFTGSGSVQGGVPELLFALT